MLGGDGWERGRAEGEYRGKGERSREGKGLTTSWAVTETAARAMRRRLESCMLMFVWLSEECRRYLPDRYKRGKVLVSGVSRWCF